MTKIFVYGTLLRGHGNHRLLEHARFLGKAFTEPVFTMLHLGGFPGIVGGGETTIYGELYEVDATTLHQLDRLEGHPGFYERLPITATLDDGTSVLSEAYILPATWRDRAPVITTGQWRGAIHGRGK